MGAFNLSGRRVGGSKVSVLDIDQPGDDGLFGVRQLSTEGYEGAMGDKILDLVGFSAEIIGQSLRFYFVNTRPAVDENKKARHPATVNYTIDIFDLPRGGTTMKHIRTVADPAIRTPNRVAATGDGGFVFTNDHTSIGD